MTSTANAPIVAADTRPFVDTRVARWIPPLLYIVLAATFWPKFHYIQWKDELNWITIAERYARGAWDIAPNAFWPPLLSWLEAVPIALGVPSVIAAKVVSVLIGLLAYSAFSQLLRALHVGGAARLAFSLAMAPCLTYFAYFAAAADLLLAALIGFYISITMLPAPSRGMRHALACGALGALMYFCKGYALYFFLAHYGCVSLVELRVAETARARFASITHGLAALAVLGTLIAPWVAMLHSKYGFTTLGVIGPYNFAMRSPDSPDAPPATYLGLFPPPPETTVSVWEEPIYLARQLPSWSPFDSRRAMAHQRWLMEQAGRVTLESLQSFSLLWLVILAGTCLFWARPIDPKIRWPLGVGLLTVAIYPAGYLIIHMEARYLWPIHFLLVAFAALLTQRAWQASWFRQGWVKGLVAAAFIASFLVLPGRGLLAQNRQAEDIDTLRRTVAADGRLNGAHLASNGTPAHYAYSVLLAYHIGAKYYGQPAPNDTPAHIEAELVRLGVEYYLVWDGAMVESATLRPYAQFPFQGRILKIYAVHRN